MAFMKSEDAVSPVIGVILMVAITVILAAIIASFVFGSAANIQKTKIVATTVQLDQDGSTIIIVYQGGQDDASLTSLTITAPDSTVWHTIDKTGTLSDSGTIYDRPNIGAVMKLDPPPLGWPSGQKHVVVVGAFGDTPSQVIADTFL